MRTGVKDLLKRADMGLFKAKASGWERVPRVCHPLRGSGTNQVYQYFLGGSVVPMWVISPSMILNISPASVVQASPSSGGFGKERCPRNISWSPM